MMIVQIKDFSVWGWRGERGGNEVEAEYEYREKRCGQGIQSKAAI